MSKKSDIIYIPYTQRTVRYKMKLLKEYLDTGWTLVGTCELKSDLPREPDQAFILTRKARKS
jgi:hypothetical protein